RQEDQEVGLLALIDSYLPEHQVNDGTGEQDDRAIFQAFLRTLGFSDQQLETIENAYESPNQSMAKVQELGVTAGLIPHGIDPAVPQRLFDVYRGHVRAFEKFKPRPTDLVAHLWNAKESLDYQNYPGNDRNGSGSYAASNIHTVQVWEKYTAR